MDYIERVVSVDPFDGLPVKFDVADASGHVFFEGAAPIDSR